MKKSGTLDTLLEAVEEELKEAKKENIKLKEERAVLFSACDTAKNDIQMLLDGECEYNEENLKATINMLNKAMKLTLKV